MPESPGWITADWPAPPRVRAGTSTRTGGVSRGHYTSLNLAGHVGDEENHVRENRKRIRSALSLPADPAWLHQVHGNRIIGATMETGKMDKADGAYTQQENVVCAVLTADCLPLLLCNRQGTEIAAVHVGWRGFSANIIVAALEQFHCGKQEILAWLGPCISARCYETGDEVRNACLQVMPNAVNAFRSTRPGHWQTSLAQLARMQLRERGVDQIYGGQYCTYSAPEFFYSWRRDGACGRNASFIWMDSTER